MSVIIAIFYWALLLSAVSIYADESTARLQRLYDQIFGANIRTLTPAETRETISELRSLLDLNVNRTGDVERREVLSWSDLAINPKQSHCDEQIGAKLRDIGRGEGSVDMLLFVQSLRADLLEYCLGIQDQLFLGAVGKIPSKELDLILSFAANSSSPQVDFDKVAAYLAPFFDPPTQTHWLGLKRRFPNIHSDTTRIYNEKVGLVCKTITDLPESAKRAIRYFDKEASPDSWSLLGRKWLRADKICSSINDHKEHMAIQVTLEINKYFAHNRAIGF